MTAELSTTPTRRATTQNLGEIAKRGRQLWDSIYAPFEDKLVEKLGVAHPDLPVHILGSHYGPLLADPKEREGLARTGRVVTSLVAVACLRAQRGVGPQVLSHVFGLRKGWEDGTWKGDGEEEDGEVVEWLVGDEGVEWVLRTVDRIADVLVGSGAREVKL